MERLEPIQYHFERCNIILIDCRKYVVELEHILVWAAVVLVIYDEPLISAAPRSRREINGGE